MNGGLSPCRPKTGLSGTSNFSDISSIMSTPAFPGARSDRAAGGVLSKAVTKLTQDQAIGALRPEGNAFCILLLTRREIVGSFLAGRCTGGRDQRLDIVRRDT